ncbi:MAG: hypothetical protein PHU51_05105 [Candidatus Nanoarchaeia archaeon]|nr:hypothetical protein [Candidatus Nanoarchaeia archaeon]
MTNELYLDEKVLELSDLKTNFCIIVGARQGTFEFAEKGIVAMYIENKEPKIVYTPYTVPESYLGFDDIMYSLQGLLKIIPEENKQNIFAKNKLSATLKQTINSKLGGLSVIELNSFEQSCLDSLINYMQEKSS